MTKAEAGHRGGTACRLRQGLDYVPMILMAGIHSLILQVPIQTEYFSIQGSKGGSTTLERHGREHMQAIGKRGGRPKKKEDINGNGSAINSADTEAIPDILS